jgi:flagellar export protein FliJ
MPFHFPLQAVLHLRESIEHQQELRLRAANQQVGRVRHLIEQMDARRQELRDMQMQELSAGITSAELQFELLREAELLLHRRELEQQLVRLQQLRDQPRQVFYQARRARETLQAVRDQQLRIYQKDASRREQRNLDDLFLMRREYLRRS